MRYNDDMIQGNVPKKIRERVKVNMEIYLLDLADAFEEAVRALAKPNTELWKAWYHSDYRAFIPSAYLDEYLDFAKHPLKYSA